MQEEIQYRKLDPQYVITIRKAVESRQEILNGLCLLKEHIPAHLITGPAFCIFFYVTSVKEGDDVEYGFPVINADELSPFHPHLSSSLEVLEFLHTASLADLGNSYKKLGQWTRDHAILSEEFIREEYPELNSQNNDKLTEESIESCVRIQFVIHDWMQKLTDQIPKTFIPIIIGESEAMNIHSTEETKFQWIQAMLERLEKHTTELNGYEILSKCSHVFPQEMILKARQAYEQALQSSGEFLVAIDETLKFMNQNGWGSVPTREGYSLFEKKPPRDPKGYESATSLVDKRKAYCFCPLIRNHLEERIQDSFCDCGSGWYRQQWEGVLQKPVRIERPHSLLRGDDYCSFKIYLPKNL